MCFHSSHRFNLRTDSHTTGLTQHTPVTPPQRPIEWHLPRWEEGKVPFSPEYVDPRRVFCENKEHSWPRDLDGWANPPILSCRTCRAAHRASKFPCECGRVFNGPDDLCLCGRAWEWPKCEKCGNIETNCSCMSETQESTKEVSDSDWANLIHTDDYAFRRWCREQDAANQITGGSSWKGY